MKIAPELTMKCQQVKVRLDAAKQLGQPILLFCEKYSTALKIFGLVLYRFALDINYCFSLSPLYAYMDFPLSPSLPRILLSWMVTVILITPIVFFGHGKTASSIMVLILNLIYFFPLQTLYAFRGLQVGFYAASLIYWFMLLLAQSFIPAFHFSFPEKFNTRLLFSIASVSVVLFVLYFSWRYTGFRIIFDLGSVYTFRTDAAALSIGRLMGYAFAIAAPVIPVLLLYAISHKRYFSVAALAVAQFLHFSIDGMKSTLFLLVLAFVGFLFYRENRIHFFSWVLSGGAFLATAETLFVHSSYLTSYAYRRAMMLPVLISSYYYDFFTTYTPDLWRSGVLRWFGVESPYIDSVGNMIGRVYSHAETNMCNGMVGDALFCFGFVGVFIMPLIVVLCTRFLDACSYNIDKRYLVGMCAYFAFLFTNSSWSSLMLSKGLIAVGLVFALWASEQNMLTGESLSLEQNKWHLPEKME